MTTTIDREAVLHCLSRLVTPGIKMTALADELGARKQDFAELRGLMFDLVEDGTVQVLPGGAFALAPAGRAPDPKAKRTREPAAAPQPAPRAVAAPALPWKKPAQVHVTPPPPRPARPAPAASASGATTAADDRIKGRITVHPAGYGFVATDDGQTVFVPAKFRGTSLDGDRVAVDTWPGVRGTEGRVDEVLARGRARLTGILRRVGRAVYLEPDDPRIAADYGRVSLDDAPSGKDGEAVVVEITRYPDAIRRELAGKVLKVLGDPEDPRVEIEKILACAVIPAEFPDAAIAQAVNTPTELGPNDLANRIDLRDRRFATIDPETARDFDDALCIEDGPFGTRVWVAVADVSHYVRWDDALDREAVIRGVSVYLPDRVISMLPHQLSAGICSLNPLVDRCAMVVRLDYTDDAELKDVSYAAAAIRSKGRLDYPGVAAALNGDFRGRREEYRGWATELHKLDTLAQKLRKKRQARGSLDLEIAEPKVILDADDPRLVRDVVKAKGDPAVKQAYQLVEEFMIAANEAVGAFFRKRDAVTVWRVHAPPAATRVKLLAELMNSYGIEVDEEAARTPLGMKVVLDQIAEKEGAQALSLLVLRTLTQAVWDTTPIGHFGLASADYLHFTSPIRRYPDLLVHRLLKYHLHRDGHASGGGYEGTPPDQARLTELAAASSANERRAMEAEREAVAMYRAYLMRDQVGEQFAGTVSAVTNFGAFVEIEEPFVEGLIKLEALGDDQFAYDQIHMRLSGRRTGKTIELGDKVTVEILNVSVIRRRIEFGLVQGGKLAAQRPVPTVTTNARAPIGSRLKAGRAVERAQREPREQRQQPSRGARPDREVRDVRDSRGGASGGGGGARGSAPSATRPGAKPKPKLSASGGKVRLKVSHRGMAGGGGGGGGDAGKPKAGGRPGAKPKRR